MPTQTQKQTPPPGARVFEPRVARIYCRTCRALFGKTLSLMAGEAQQQGKWYGSLCTQFIDWLLRDPKHCANELRNAKYEWLRAS